MSKIKNKKTNALRILEQQSVSYELQEYEYDPEALSIGALSKVNDFPIERIYKTLVLKGDKTGPVVAVIPGDKSLIMKQLAKVSGNKKVTLVPLKDLENLTGYVRGGCSPVGMKKLFPVFLDESAQALGQIYVNAGQRGLLMRVEAEELAAVVDGRFTDLAT